MALVDFTTDWCQCIFAIFGFFINKVEITFCKPLGGLAFRHTQKSEVSIGSGHAFDPTLSQKKVELVQGCFGDFLLLAHFRRSGLYL